MSRILVIRGGAIGDFILTLPALKAVREAHPNSHIEILGYKHVAVLAENRFYAQVVRSIEYAPLSRFFARNSELPGELANYFASFDLILSYLYDPDQIFEANLRRCGVENLLCGPGRITEAAGHAARQLSRPIEALGIKVPDLTERIFPSINDRKFAWEFLGLLQQPIIAIHPGSGSTEKNWPVENWLSLFSRSGGFPAAVTNCTQSQICSSLVVISGEADQPQIERLQREWRDSNVRFANDLPLPHLAAVLERCIFIGHDSGISHLAAAAGAPCVLLFGPTNPDVWAPRNKEVQVIRAPNGRLKNLEISMVEAAVATAVGS